MKPFWGKHRIALHDTLHWELGPLDLYVKRAPGEWLVHVSHQGDLSDDDRWLLASPADFPESGNIRRFAFDSVESDPRLILEPGFPDRAVVSRPSVPIEIPSRSQASFLCGVPLQVHLRVKGAHSLVHLITIPTRLLSRTWFGTPIEGEACYASYTRAVREAESLPPHGFRFICPVTIINRSSEALPFDRACLRVRHLNLYQGKDYLWSNEIRVTKSGRKEVSEVTYVAGAPARDRNAQLIFETPDNPNSIGLLQRTFNNLRTFALDPQ